MQAQNNKFSTMPYIPFKIVMALLDNDNFCKLIYYNTMDALDKPNLTIEQKRALIWDGNIDRTDKFNIFLTNVQPNEEIDNRTVLKIYRYQTAPSNNVRAVLSYRFDLLFGSKIPLVKLNGITCNRGDVIEMEIMKTLNGEDVAGVGFLQYDERLSALCSSRVGIGNNYTFTGLTIVMATQVADVEQPSIC
jgi:hypothetical protein